MTLHRTITIDERRCHFVGGRCRRFVRAYIPTPSSRRRLYRVIIRYEQSGVITRGSYASGVQHCAVRPQEKEGVFVPPTIPARCTSDNTL